MYLLHIFPCVWAQVRKLHGAQFTKKYKFWGTKMKLTKSESKLVKELLEIAADFDCEDMSCGGCILDDTKMGCMSIMAKYLISKIKKEQK